MYLLLLVLALPLLASTLSFITQQKPLVAILSTQAMLILALIGTVVATQVVVMPTLFTATFLKTGTLNLSIAFMWDPLTATMLLLTTFMSLVIHAYVSRYMLSDLTQARFMAQLSLTTVAVMILVMSGNLLTAFIGWQWIGLSLYLLLNHYHYDLKANQAAKKKFIINRLGDVCFLLAIVLALQHYNTTDFEALFNANNIFLSLMSVTISLKAVIISLVFVAVMTKSAQFPFHIWLPDTMETPTPVSALMHAGIINAGGFLLARLSPLVIQSPPVMGFIFSIGVATLLCGCFFLLTQTDVKRQLAYSTMGQMGYMIMQCGLGCFTAAIFHLISHGFYKASLFLNSGNAIDYYPKFNKKQNTIRQHWHQSLIALGLAIVVLVFWLSLLNTSHHPIKTNAILLIFIAISITQFIRHSFNTWASWKQRSIQCLIITLITGLYFFLLDGFSSLLSTSIAEKIPAIAAWQYGVIALLVILQISFWMIPLTSIQHYKWYKKIYIISLNKSYIEEFYRHCLLMPLRKMGDLCKPALTSNGKTTSLSQISLLGLLTLSIIYGVMSWWGHSAHSHPIMLIINIVILIVVLLATNRAQLCSLFTLLVCGEIALVNMGLLNNLASSQTAAIFQLINMLILLIALHLLLRKKQQINIRKTIERNIIPWPGLYLSILLLSLIGIPGTASFISEILILRGLVEINIFFAISLIFGIILFAIVVLRLLQVYVFDSSKITINHIQLSAGVHVMCILSIALNILNGLFPDTLLQLLQQARG